MSVLPLPAPVLAAVDGGDPFAVRRIYCVGRNYEAHAREMGHADREPPFFFSKFPDALLASGGELPYPPETADLHYEGELVVALGRPAFRVTPEAALRAVFGYAAGLDMTRRDLQAAAKKAGKPWDLSKNFTGSAVLGPVTPKESWNGPTRGRLQLSVNGELRQDADLSEMIWSVAEVIAHLSGYDRLAPGDLIYTGTPAGVGAVASGDRLEVRVDGLAPCTLAIGDPACGA
jgi:fumarylpyruvate hydrolase